jgi:hypothetical protein
MANDIILSPQPMAPSVVVQGEVIARVSALCESLIAAPAITDQASLDQVRAIMKGASKLVSDVDVQRSLAKQPWAAVATAIDDAARPIKDQLKAVVEECKEQIRVFLAEQDRIRAEAAKAQAIATAAAAASLAAGHAPVMAVTIQPQTIVAPTRKDYEWVVLDRSLIPAEYFDIAWDRINWDTDRGIVIPGVQKRETTTIVAR